MLGIFPFGGPLRPVVKIDRGLKDVFVLEVYSSAVHALGWVGREDTDYGARGGGGVPVGPRRAMD